MKQSETLKWSVLLQHTSACYKTVVLLLRTEMIKFILKLGEKTIDFF